MTPLRIALVGANGRMGKFVQRLLASEDDLEIVCRIDRGDDLHRVLSEVQPTVGLDFTVAGMGAVHALAMLECGVRPVVGTSGVTSAEDAVLDATARAGRLAGLIVPNFCLGVWLQQELARLAALFLPSVAIVEEHHQKKKDAPSGTAIDTAAQLAGVKGVAPSSIPVHSVRLQGLYSNQTVLFGGPGEVVRITHQTYGLDAFGPGVLAALRYVAAAEPGVRRGIGHAFEWQRKQRA